MVLSKYPRVTLGKSVTYYIIIAKDIEILQASIRRSVRHLFWGVRRRVSSQKTPNSYWHSFVEVFEVILERYSESHISIANGIEPLLASVEVSANCFENSKPRIIVNNIEVQLAFVEVAANHSEKVRVTRIIAKDFELVLASSKCPRVILGNSKSRLIAKGIVFFMASVEVPTSHSEKLQVTYHRKRQRSSSERSHFIENYVNVWYWLWSKMSSYLPRKATRAVNSLRPADILIFEW